jgi:hypothetical protein
VLAAIARGAPPPACLTVSHVHHVSIRACMCGLGAVQSSPPCLSADPGPMRALASLTAAPIAVRLRSGATATMAPLNFKVTVDEIAAWTTKVMAAVDGYGSACVGKGEGREGGLGGWPVLVVSSLGP